MAEGEGAGERGGKENSSFPLSPFPLVPEDGFVQNCCNI